jgi:hypothetical protein
VCIGLKSTVEPRVANQDAALIEAFEYRESRVDNPENEIPPMKIERRTLAWFKVREEQVALIQSPVSPRRQLIQL